MYQKLLPNYLYHLRLAPFEYLSLTDQIIMAPRAPTAYFIFAGEHRASIYEEIAAANNGKASVALVGKALGEKWKQLSAVEKQ